MYSVPLFKKINTLLRNYDLRNLGKDKILFAEIKKVHLEAPHDRRHIIYCTLVFSPVK